MVIAAGGSPQYIDLQSGRFANLSPTPSVVLTDKIDTEVSFQPGSDDGRGGMQWKRGGGDPVFARRINLRSETVEFHDGDVGLAGTLVLPEGKGPFPAIVVHGGSDWRVRQDYIEQAYIFAANGIAAFIYDKRGWGGSSGARVFSFSIEAQDAIAAVEAVRRRPEIEAQHVGISGFSQTGWVVPQAAVRSKDIHFLVLLSASSTTVARQELDRLEYTLRANGTPQSDIDQAVRVMKLKNQYAQTGNGWDEYLAATKEAKGKKWDFGASGPLTKTDDTWEWMHLNTFYNPLPALEHITCPVLALYGSKDTYVPPDINVPIMKLAFDEAHNPDATILVMPNGSHFLTETIDGPPKITRYVPGVWTTVISWVKAHISDRSPGAK